VLPADDVEIRDGTAIAAQAVDDAAAGRTQNRVIETEEGLRGGRDTGS
jgi:hypothetical protein